MASTRTHQEVHSLPRGSTLLQLGSISTLPETQAPGAPIAQTAPSWQVRSALLLEGGWKPVVTLLGILECVSTYIQVASTLTPSFD